MTTDRTYTHPTLNIFACLTKNPNCYVVRLWVGTHFFIRSFRSRTKANAYIKNAMGA